MMMFLFSVDGLSIEAAFSASIVEGLTIKLRSIVENCHTNWEACMVILLNSGLSLKRAAMYNTASCITFFVGSAVGVFLGELPTARVWIFAVAMQRHVLVQYISSAKISPEMMAAVEDACQTSRRVE